MQGLNFFELAFQHEIFASCTNSPIRYLSVSARACPTQLRSHAYNTEYALDSLYLLFGPSHIIVGRHFGPAHPLALVKLLEPPSQSRRGGLGDYD